MQGEFDVQLLNSSECLTKWYWCNTTLLPPLLPPRVDLSVFTVKERSYTRYTHPFPPAVSITGLEIEKGACIHISFCYTHAIGVVSAS